GVLDDDRGPFHLLEGVPLVHVRDRGRGRRDPVRDHLHAHGDRAGHGRQAGGRLMAVELPTPSRPLVPMYGWRWIARRALVYALLVAISLLFFVPFLWTLTTSFKTLPDSVNVNLLPERWVTDAWSTIWNQYDFGLYIRNSFFLAAVIVTANMVLAGLGGYAFARLRFPGREVLFWLVLATLMVPDQLRLIPVFVLLTN